MDHPPEFLLQTKPRTDKTWARLNAQGHKLSNLIYLYRGASPRDDYEHSPPAGPTGTVLRASHTKAYEDFSLVLFDNGQVSVRPLPCSTSPRPVPIPNSTSDFNFTSVGV